MSKDEIYMRRCIQLAGNGKNNVSPNPPVGAVIVRNDQIIGEGYHVRCGENHAEVNAIDTVEDASLLEDCTLYVSLEPCSHQGKTPPCADLIIGRRIPRIVIGCHDPSPKVNGKGIRKLTDAGRDVTVGVLEDECRALIAPFTVFNTLCRPYIVLKWAESADGYIDINRTGGNPVRLSTPLTAMLAHKRRAEADAIMVGTRTAVLDNPALTVRNWYGKNPTRVVPDRHLTLSPSLRLFDDSARTLVYTHKLRQPRGKTEFITLGREQNLLPQILGDLHGRGIQTLLVEGGSCLLKSFIDNNLWDEIYVEESKTVLGAGVKAPLPERKITHSTGLFFGIPVKHYRNEKT